MISMGQGADGDGSDPVLHCPNSCGSTCIKS